MERKIYKTRPTSVLNADETKIYDVIDELALEFERVDRTDNDNESEEVYEILSVKHLKNLLLCNAGKTRFYLLTMPSDVPFKSSVLSKQLGTSRFSFAPEEYLKEFLHAVPGTSSVLGLVFDTEHKVQPVIDERVLEEGVFGCLPCSNSASLKFKTSDITDKFLKYTGHSFLTVRM